VYKDGEEKMECRNKETVKEKGKSRNERKRMKETWRKEKQKKKEGVKESRNFHPTLVINVLFFDLLEKSRLATINKADVLLRTQFLRPLWLSTSIAKCTGEDARSSPCSKTH